MKQSEMEIFVTMEKGSSFVWTVVIPKPIKLEISASTQMTDNLPKFDTMEFTSYFTANIGLIQGVLGGIWCSACYYLIFHFF